MKINEKISKLSESLPISLETNEFHLICDFLNGTMYTNKNTFLTDTLVSDLMGSLDYQRLDLKWDVNMDTLADKLKGLTDDETKVLLKMVGAFWG